MSSTNYNNMTTHTLRENQKCMYEKARNIFWRWYIANRLPWESKVNANDAKHAYMCLHEVIEIEKELARREYK